MNNKGSIIEVLGEVLNNSANIDSISIEYYRMGVREHCNMKIFTDGMHNETTIITNRANTGKYDMEGTSKE